MADFFSGSEVTVLNCKFANKTQSETIWINLTSFLSYRDDIKRHSCLRPTGQKATFEHSP